jgi:hypothetical protein
MREGGYMKWEYVTLLVCIEKPPDQTTYLQTGLVEAVMHYTIQRDYKPDPIQHAVLVTVQITEIKKQEKDDPIGPSQKFKICIKLEDLLKKYGLTDTYNNPRAHTLVL